MNTYQSIFCIAILLSSSPKVSVNGEEIKSERWRRADYIQHVNNYPCARGSQNYNFPVSEIIFDDYARIWIAGIGSDPLPVEYKVDDENSELIHIKQINYSTGSFSFNNMIKDLYENAEYSILKGSDTMQLIAKLNEDLSDTVKYVKKIRGNIDISRKNLDILKLEGEYSLYSFDDKMISRNCVFHFSGQIENCIFSEFNFIRDWSSGEYKHRNLVGSVYNFIGTDKSSKNFLVEFDCNCNLKLFSFTGDEWSPKNLKLEYYLIRK
jgi:hypothetical protein